ncbi:VOC family protein [Nocardia callitridis]|uniref:VOC domain-containing protein n=1 Tax=Nocardia callitridis TaxID=648753 RepID=A0ABP9KX98_9NOCA
MTHQIRKTYARVLTTDLDGTLQTLRALVGAEADFRVHFGRFDLALIGEFCVVAGAEEALARYRGTVGPVIVADLAATFSLVEGTGAEVTVPPFDGPAGRGFLARHTDGVEFEYIEFSSDLAERLLDTEGVGARNEG